MRRLLVVKVGGALAAIEGALPRAGTAIARLAATRPVLVVPGGGPFADQVRAVQHRLGVSDDAAHWMAILAMDQYAHVLTERIPGATLVERYGEIGGAVGRGFAAVLAPHRWLRDADTLPRGWDVTSDSIAAFIAGALDAERLLLVKAVPGELEAVADRALRRVAPHDLPIEVVGLERLATWHDGGAEAPHRQG
ncbi:MAG: hypothetical protein NW201_02025 [Gemmatimonadales bacterium]|nr:hypothetical protein [Gemmatimonadales bacterium]